MARRSDRRFAVNGLLTCIDERFAARLSGRAFGPRDIDLDAGTVTIRTNRVELLETRQAFDAPPKTDAGKRTIAVPPHVLSILTVHMREWSGPDRVFVGRDSKPMRGDAVRQAFTRARRKADMPGFRFHDLRHTDQTLAEIGGVASDATFPGGTVISTV